VERIQDRHQEDSALTYYEDLGLSARASGEEVRQAYLNLVRLLHPDLSSEPSLKRFSENQLKRVSRAYAVLSDPDRRRRYDAQLEKGDEEEPPEPVSARRSAGRSRARAWITLGWLICAFAGIVGIGWYMSQQAGAPSEPAQVSAAPNPPAAAATSSAQPTTASSGTTDKSGDLDSLRADLAAAKADRDRALEQTVLQAKELDFLTGRVLSGRPAPGSSRLAGVWLLPVSKVAAMASAFTPEAVDLILNVQQDVVQGRFRARYPGMGAPDPPMVRFYFEGKLQDDVVNATWNGEDGSKGEIQLKLSSDNALQLVWSTTQLGKQSGPDSGTLALVRKFGL
jgi:curved DNA-binding protein CbpA